MIVESRYRHSISVNLAKRLTNGLTSRHLLHVQFNKQQTYSREGCRGCDVHRGFGGFSTGDRDRNTSAALTLLLRRK